jgi:hypothetical protein
MCFGALVLMCAGALVHGTGARAHQSTGAPPTGIIAGTVLDAATSQPTAGVSVSMSLALSSQSEVLTDSQGRFIFTSLAPGRYIFRIRHEGYAPVKGASVNLAEGGQVTDVVLRAGRHGAIAGTLRDDAGDPVSGSGVTAFSRRSVGFRSLLFPRGATVSDDRGQYRIGDLPPGEYLICACRREPVPIDKALLPPLLRATVPAATDARELKDDVPAFPPTLHPASTTVSRASLVTIGYGEERQGIDILMQPVVPRRVSGRIVGGDPKRGSVKLALVRANDDPAAIGISQSSPVHLTPDGAFEFTAVVPGDYTIEAFPAESGRGPTGTVALTVDDRDITGIVVPLGAGAAVKGRLEFSGTSVRPDARTLRATLITLVPLTLSPSAMIHIGNTGSVGYFRAISADGAFELGGLFPGKYLVRVGNLGNWRTVESITTLSGRNLDAIVDVPPSGLDSVVVTMADAVPATLQVTLELEKYELPSDVRVAIFPVDDSLWSDPFSAPFRFSTSPVNAEGAASFAAVPAGDYYVAEVSESESVFSAQRIGDWARRATIVRVRAGEKTALRLRR